METSSTRVRRAFTEAAGFVSELVDTIEDHQWSLPASAEWTVAELVVHTTRAGSTIVTYASVEAEPEVPSAAAYYLRVLDAEGIHEAVAERARLQAAEVEVPLGAYVRQVFADAEKTLARTPAGQVLGTRAGGIRLVDYLPTRVVELVVHGIDLADALGRSPNVPPLPMAVTLETLAELSVARPAAVDPVQIVRALTGRGELPEGSDLLE